MQLKCQKPNKPLGAAIAARLAKQKAQEAMPPGQWHTTGMEVANATQDDVTGDHNKNDSDDDQ
jgi:hypothetical protein